jgi:hypothetical protein
VFGCGGSDPHFGDGADPPIFLVAPLNLGTEWTQHMFGWRNWEYELDGKITMLLFGVFRWELLIKFFPLLLHHIVYHGRPLPSARAAAKARSWACSAAAQPRAAWPARTQAGSAAAGLACRPSSSPPPGGPALSRSIAFRRKRGLENMGRLRPPNSGGSAEPGSLRNIPVRDQPNPPRDGNEDPIPHSPRGIPLLGDVNYWGIG